MGKKKSGKKKSGKKKADGGDGDEGVDPAVVQAQAEAIRERLIDWHHNVATTGRQPSTAFQAYLDRAAAGEPAWLPGVGVGGGGAAKKSSGKKKSSKKKSGKKKKK